MKKLILFILILPSLLFAQRRFDSIGLYGVELALADTAILKTLTPTESDSQGAITHVMWLAFGGSLEGGGDFLYADSAYIENGGIAFDAPTDGKQWVRKEFILKNVVYPQWWGAKGDNSSNDSTAIRKMNRFAPVYKSTMMYPEGTYLARNFVIDSHSYMKGMDGAIIKHAVGTPTKFLVNDTTRTTGTMTTGDSTLTVASATDLEVGVMVAVWGAGSKEGYTWDELTGGINDVVASLEFDSSASVHRFPTSAAVSRLLLIGTELITYTGRNLVAHTFTGLGRGAYGSTAASHSAGDTIWYCVGLVSKVNSVSGTTAILNDTALVSVTSAVTTIGRTDIKIDNIDWDGNKQNLTGTIVSAFDIMLVTDLKVMNCTIKNMTQNAIQLNASQYNSIKNNWFFNNGSPGTGNSMALTMRSSHNQITGNFTLGFGDIGVGGENNNDGIYISNGSSPTIQWHGESMLNKVVDNFFYVTNENIVIEGSAKNTIEDNTINGQGITNSKGVYIEASNPLGVNPVSANNYIRKNTITGCYLGIACASGAGDDNYFQDNTITDTPSGGTAVTQDDGVFSNNGDMLGSDDANVIWKSSQGDFRFDSDATDGARIKVANIGLTHLVEIGIDEAGTDTTRIVLKGATGSSTGILGVIDFFRSGSSEATAFIYGKRDGDSTTGALEFWTGKNYADARGMKIDSDQMVTIDKHMTVNDSLKINGDWIPLIDMDADTLKITIGLKIVNIAPDTTWVISR